jgi:hypothetical protein
VACGGRARPPQTSPAHPLPPACAQPVLPPAADFVELPASYAELRYSNILCGVIRGALEMVSLKVTCAFVKDALAGDDSTEIRVALVEVLGEGAGAAYEDD